MRQNTLVSVMLVAIGTLWCTGCTTALPRSARSVLENGDSYTLMLIHRDMSRSGHECATFHEFVVDKAVVISDPGARRQLASTLKASVIDGDFAAGCLFMPHYGVHVVRRGRTLDMEICFHCGQCLVYDGGDNGKMYSVDADTKAVLSALAGE